MTKKISRACVAAFSMILASAAQAVPLYLDFTGTVIFDSFPPGEGANFGDPVSGGLNTDTDRLTLDDDSPVALVYVDWQPPADPLLPMAFFNAPGRNVTLPVHDSINYSLARFNFSCGDTCEPYVNDVFLMAMSTEQPEAGVPADFNGQLHSTSLWLLAGLANPLPPDVLLSNPNGLNFIFTYGQYNEEIFDCVAGVCLSSGISSLGFSIDSYVVGIGPRTPVPEPATLGLLGIGLLGAFATRRRRLQA